MQLTYPKLKKGKKKKNTQTLESQVTLPKRKIRNPNTPKKKKMARAQAAAAGASDLQYLKDLSTFQKGLADHIDRQAITIEGYLQRSQRQRAPPAPVPHVSVGQMVTYRGGRQQFRVLEFAGTLFADGQDGVRLDNGNWVPVSDVQVVPLEKWYL